MTKDITAYKSNNSPAKVTSRLIHRNKWLFQCMSDRSYQLWIPAIFKHISKCKLCNGKFDRNDESIKK